MRYVPARSQEPTPKPSSLHKITIMRSVMSAIEHVIKTSCERVGVSPDVQTERRKLNGLSNWLLSLIQLSREYWWVIFRYLSADPGQSKLLEHLHCKWTHCRELSNAVAGYQGFSLKRFGVSWLLETLLCCMRQRQSQACALKLVRVYATANETQPSVSRSVSISTNHLLAKVRGLVAFFWASCPSSAISMESNQSSKSGFNFY